MVLDKGRVMKGGQLREKVLESREYGCIIEKGCNREEV